MSRITLAAGVVVLLLVGAVVGLAYGVGPAPGGADSSGDIDDFPTETDYSATGSSSTDSSTQDTGNGDGETRAGSSLPFAFSIDQIEECGTTCRDVTVTLYNQQNETAENVTVYTRIYAGNSTAEDDHIWQGKADVGTMSADSPVTDTKRVSLSYADAYAVEQNDGWVTIVTVVQSDDETVTFEEQRDVN